MVKLTDENITDILTSSLEGGVTSDWCCKVTVVGEYLGEYASEQVSRGGMLTFSMWDPTEADVTLTKADFVEGFRKWYEEGGDWYEAVTENGVNTGNIDAGRADAIVQYALFGELVYG